MSRSNWRNVLQHSDLPKILDFFLYNIPRKFWHFHLISFSVWHFNSTDLEVQFKKRPSRLLERCPVAQSNLLNPELLLSKPNQQIHPNLISYSFQIPPTHSEHIPNSPQVTCQYKLAKPCNSSLYCMSSPVSLWALSS